LCLYLSRAEFRAVCRWKLGDQYGRADHLLESSSERASLVCREPRLDGSRRIECRSLQRHEGDGQVCGRHRDDRHSGSVILLVGRRGGAGVQMKGAVGPGDRRHVIVAVDHEIGRHFLGQPGDVARVKTHFRSAVRGDRGGRVAAKPRCWQVHGPWSRVNPPAAAFDLVGHSQAQAGADTGKESRRLAALRQGLVS